MDPREVQAIFNTLIESVKTGYSAVLTPEDCHALLSIFSSMNHRGSRRPRSSTVQSILDHMVDNLSQGFEEAMRDVTGKRKKRK